MEVEPVASATLAITYLEEALAAEVLAVDEIAAVEISVDSPADIHLAFIDVLQELRGQHAIGDDPSQTANDGSWHDVRVEVGSPGVRTRTHSGSVDH